LIYTIPSNIYMLASILVTFFLYSIYYKKLKKKDVRTYYKAIIFIVLGIGIAIILYLPILKNIIFNEFSTREASSIFYSLELMPKLFLAFLSKRYLLVILFIIGCWLFVRQSEQKEKKLHFFLLLIFLIPFILSFIHQKFPFQRVFISLSPIFSILITVPILFSIQKIKNSSLKKYFAFIVTIYCIVVFLYEMKNNDIEISNKLVTKGEITQDIYQNYYLSSSFNQSETMKYLKSISGNKDVFLYNQIDYPSTYLYLTINEVNFTAVESKKKLEQIILNNDTTILLSSFKSELSNELNNINEIETTVLMDKYPITNIIRVTKK
ncbi:MAG: hypothetical protein WD512_06410, partial [Candidatus Paceibacterota bacterium]